MLPLTGTALSTLLRPLLGGLHCEHPWDAARWINGAPQVRLVFFVLTIVAPAMTTMAVLIYFIRARDVANVRAETLLLQILPRVIVARLKRGETQIADGHDDATVLFADIVGFTAFADAVTPDRLVHLLSRVFNELDALAARYGLEKIKTLGDGYLAVAGVTRPRPDHARAATAMAVDVQPTLVRCLANDWPGLRLRVGLATGPVVAGVIGHERLGFDVGVTPSTPRAVWPVTSSPAGSRSQRRLTLPSANTIGVSAGKLSR